MSVCQHCHRIRDLRRHGLCWTCYYRANIRKQYLPQHRYTDPALDNRRVRPEPTATAATPGSLEKVCVLEARILAGEQLWHADDATGDGASAADCWCDPVFQRMGEGVRMAKRRRSQFARRLDGERCGRVRIRVLSYRFFMDED